MEFVRCINAINTTFLAYPAVVVAFRSLAIHSPFTLSVEFIYTSFLYAFSLDYYVDL